MYTLLLCRRYLGAASYAEPPAAAEAPAAKAPAALAPLQAAAVAATAVALLSGECIKAARRGQRVPVTSTGLSFSMLISNMPVDVAERLKPSRSAASSQAATSASRLDKGPDVSSDAASAQLLALRASTSASMDICAASGRQHRARTGQEELWACWPEEQGCSTKWFWWATLDKVKPTCRGRLAVTGNSSGGCPNLFTGHEFLKSKTCRVRAEGMTVRASPPPSPPPPSYCAFPTVARAADERRACAARPGVEAVSAG
eukprot:364189-Chlamydomonas_euryale.AAC.30